MFNLSSKSSKVKIWLCEIKLRNVRLISLEFRLFECDITITLDAFMLGESLLHDPWKQIL
jgi:hypothetical protein